MNINTYIADRDLRLPTLTCKYKGYGLYLIVYVHSYQTDDGLLVMINDKYIRKTWEEDTTSEWGFLQREFVTMESHRSKAEYLECTPCQRYPRREYGKDVPIRIYKYEDLKK